MVINGFSLLKAAPIKDMESTKVARHGVSFGLGEAGYDIRIKQNIVFLPNEPEGPLIRVAHSNGGPVSSGTYGEFFKGRFTLASAIEEFDMPTDLVGVVHDKSTWARQGLSVFNTVIEPGWKGFLTIELVFHGNKDVVIPAGTGIAQVIFTSLAHDASYEGKYQHQADMPVPSVFD